MADLEVIGQFVAGPASAVFVCLLVMHKGYKLVVDTILPSYEKRLTDILEEGKKDRELFRTAIELMDRRFQGLEKSLGGLRKDVTDIEKELKGMKG